MDGILLINKPAGITSYDVIRQVKKIFKTSKVGHTGTLDPFATGLMIVCINKTTKLVKKLIEANKTYRGTILFNLETDTFDITGQVIKKANNINDFNKIKLTANSFIGKYLQIPPIYSAIKVDGKKLYEYARNDETVELKQREVEIYDFKVIDQLSENEFTFEAFVSKGTYIRSLVVDLASKLNTIATVKTLERTKINQFNLNSAVDLENLNENNLIKVEDLYENSSKVILNDYMIGLVKNGIYLDERQIITTEDFLVYDSNNNLIALYEVIDVNTYRPLIIF